MSIQVTACLNPFSGERKEFSFEQGITINEIIRNLDALNAVNTGWRVMIDDEIVTDFERVPEEGQRVYIKLVPEGDNKDAGIGMKVVGGALVVIGVVVAALTSWTGIGGFAGMALIGAGVGLFSGGVVLYNIDLSADREKPEQDPSIRGSRNQMRPYGKVPVLLGKRRIYADVCANPYTWVDSNGAIWLHQLFCVAQKDIQIDTATLKIDETLLKDYSATGDISRVLDQSNPDPLIQMKISYGDSTPPLYNKCVHEIQCNSELKHQTEDGQDGSVIRTTPAKTTEINVDVFFYNGLGKYSDKGDVQETSVELRAEYKKSTDPDSAYQLLGYFSEGSNTISGSELKTKRYAITKDNLAADSYTVKISRVTADSTDTKIIDTVYVGSIRAANNDTPVRSARCQQVTLIGLKIKASEKLNNIVEQLNFIAQSKMPVYNSQSHQWTNALTSNPASAAMYAMQGEVAQQRLSNSDIDLDSFAALYSWCANHDYECNAYITDDMTINDLLSSIASTCRAEILRMNGKITVIQDIAKDSFVQLFTPRNSHDYKETMALADIPDVLKMGIVDKTNGYAENEVPVYNTPSGNPVSGVEPQTSQSVPLWGVTDSVQARKLAMYNYAVIKHRFTIVRFSCDFEYLMCRKGDWIKYAGDIALAGLKQGRIEAVDGQKLILDEQVTMESGKTYAVRIRKSDGTAALCNVQTVVGTSNEITISEQIPSGIEGCLFAFGVTGNETIDLIVTDIQCGENLSADLICVEYAPEIFGVDDPDFVLPDFVNKLSDFESVVDPGAVDGWRTFATYNDSDSRPATPTGGGTSGSWHLQQTENSKWISTKTAASIYEGEWSAPVPTGKKVMDVLVPDGEIGNPDPVEGLTAIAREENIFVSWRAPNNNGLSNSIKGYVVEISRNSGTAWTQLVETFSSDFTYVFDRTTDKYPEATAPQQRESGMVYLSDYRFRIKAVNIYGYESSYVTTTVNTNGYGTWKIPSISIIREVIDRTAILTAVFNGSVTNVYGLNQLKVWIKRNGNTDAEGGQSFNHILHVTPDETWYTPEFNESVMGSETTDTEKNYHKFDDGTALTDPYISSSYKISHTLPLIGQCPRLYKGTEWLGFAFDVMDAEVPSITEVTEIPASPVENQIILYNGETTATYTQGTYYIYQNSDWSEVQEDYVIKYTGNATEDFATGYYYIFENGWTALSKRTTIVPTEYVYKITMFNESCTLYPQNAREASDTYVQALCTNIADIVHSHEHYKNLYVEKLSAINANLGMITRGGMGSFEEDDNCWALSDLSPEDSGVAEGVMKGTFRVGDDKEYFRVTPHKKGDGTRYYTIELKAGNIELTSDISGESAMDFANGTFVYSSDRKSRMALTPTGIVVQSYSGDPTTDRDWSKHPEYIQDLSRVFADSNGNMIISNAEEEELPSFGYQVDGTIYHFDDYQNPENEEVGEGETPSNPESIDCSDGSVVSTSNLSPVLVDSKSCFEGTIVKSLSGFGVGTIVFFSKSEKVDVCGYLIDTNGQVEYNPLIMAKNYNDKMNDDYDQTESWGEYIGLTPEQISSNIFKKWEE